MFQASYIQHARKLEPLTPADENIYIKTLFSTISAGNSHFIEPSLDAGVSLLVSSNGSNLIDLAREKNHPHIMEILLIQSMRRTELFPKNSLNKALRYALTHKQYQLIDLLVYAIRQQLSENEFFLDFINCYDYLSRLSDAAATGLLLPTHYQQFEHLISKPKVNSDALFYFYHLWDKLFKEKQQDIIKLYHIISQAYHSLIEKNHQQVKNNYYLMIVAGFLLWSTIAVLVLTQPFMLIPGYLIVGYLSYKQLKGLNSNPLLNEYKLHDAARLGDYASVEKFIQADVNINLMGGIAQSTPLFEAERIQNQQLIQLIKRNHGVSAKGSQAFSGFE